MNTKNKEEIIVNALSVICEVCSEIEYCHDCPFYSKEIDKCVIQSKRPCDWIVNNEYDIWRAVR